MASLTPGTLQKLLHNVGNKDFKVAGEHRSALLQVISIVPSLEDDPWKSRGYFLRVSDSLHSAYVSVSDEDMDLILSDKIQLGQFVHVTRLDSGSPVPVLLGVKPIPKRRPCVGDPKDLISSDFLNAKKVESKVKPKVKVKKMVENEEGNFRRLSFGNGKVVGMENRRLSLDSARKAWDRSPQSKNVGNGVKLKSRDNSLCSNSVVTNKVSNNSPNGSSISPLKNKNIVISPKLPTKPIMKISKSSDDDIFPSHFSKVAVSPKKLSDSKILWNSVPSTISNLGKEVRSYRNVAFFSAIRALEDASIYESVIRCMSMFAELCELSKKDSTGPLVEQFLSLHESMKKISLVISTMIDLNTSGTKNGNDYNSTSKNASLWVQAAVETDLSRFSLYAKRGEKGHYVVTENATEKTDIDNHYSPKQSKSVSKVRSHTRKPIFTEKGKNGKPEVWSPGLGLRDVAILAEKLLESSRAWFLDYLQDSLKNGFGLKRNEDSSQILGQLKRINQWLDDALREGNGVDERIERLRKKLYRFLLDHVDSAVSNR
ncbi:hypothetical protein ACJIZ3_016436 [Penstemon smallii]|uniref:Uncharacterized protein n=1 Tax=Penstemon smallii TaxID=265156 RepID=A0ABD3RQL9_9LAMI